MVKILLTGSGSGGHLYPLIAVAEELQKEAIEQGVSLNLRFMGANGRIKEISASVGIKFQPIISPKWRRYASVENFFDILKAPFGFIQAMYHVWAYMPDLIFSKGGFDSFLPALAGRIFMIPIVLHESDVIPGKANLWVGKWAKKVFVAFDGAGTYFKDGKVKKVGNPIREGLVNLIDRNVAINAFGLNPDRPIVLIGGGSQGSRTINDILLLSIVELASKFQIIHQCGQDNYDHVNSQIMNIVKEGEGTYGKMVSDSYRLYPSFDLQQMTAVYSAADVIVSRAGAASIFEIAAVGKPAILIPLKGSASEHQVANAQEFSKYGATVIEEENLTPHILINEIENAYEQRATISPRIKEFATPNPVKLIAKELLTMIQ